MPVGAGFFGSETDGSQNSDYCIFCYENGDFTDEDLSADAMVEISVIHMMSELGKSEREARSLAESVIPQLKRWRS